uniref:Uncharacterized protein n=1 Tax=Lotharella oceanica TaxID=641309 RepID=A0A7S2THY3_9EUKA
MASKGCSDNSRHVVSIVFIILAVIATGAAFGGTVGSDLAWTFSKVDFKETGCVVRTFWGLLEYKAEYSSECGVKGTKEVKYSDSECNEDFCSVCNSAGASVESMLVLAIISALVGFIVILIRRNDSHIGEKGCSFKRILATSAMMAMCLFTFIAWVAWAASCHEKIRNFTSDEIQGADAEKISPPYTGFILTIIASTMAFGVGMNECSIMHEDIDDDDLESIEM